MITIRQRVYAWLERNVIATLDPDDAAGYSDADRDAVESASPTCLIRRIDHTNGWNR